MSTGKKIFETCGKSIKRVTLELGGNDAAIVRQDCDLERYAQAIFNGAFTNSGQVCLKALLSFLRFYLYI